jgi:hypothetical protein
MRSSPLHSPAKCSKTLISPAILSSALLLLSPLLIQQIASAAESKPFFTESKPFTPTDFPESISKIYLHTMLNGKIVVQAIQLKRLNDKQSNPRYCRAWVSYARTKDNKSIPCNYFEDINPLGGAYGLYFPNNTMPNNYRCIVKLGDYDGRLMIINDEGKYWNLPGGSFFLSKDKQYLFSTHECDSPTGIAVFDLKNATTVFETNEKAKEVSPIVDKWYFDGTDYFFTTKEGDGSVPKGDEREIFVFDVKGRKLDKKKVSATELAAATAVNYDFNGVSETDLKTADGLDVPPTASNSNAGKEASGAK